MSSTNREIINGDIQRHFKGKLYMVIGVAEHTESEELFVMYRALYGKYEYYVRPVKMFLSEVDHIKYPEVSQIYRFEKINVGEITNDLLKSVS